MILQLLRLFVASAFLALCPTGAGAVELRGEIVDSETGQSIAARIYLRSALGTWHFAKSAAAEGAAVEYNKARGTSVEKHTSLSAHPFVADLPAGKYTLTVERGKEYLPHEEQISLADAPVRMAVKLRRFVDMAKYRWYSGETHVHRSLAELPTAMLAEDLNVALPLTYWVTKSDTAPGQGDKNSPPVKAKLIKVDDTHVIYPMNTEYEIFTVEGKSHTLGAVFALNHKTVFERGVPPVREIARQTHREGGLLELDKHNWPWSMMLVPVMNVDLYELTNNHVWRTDFHFKQFGEAPPEFMRVERDAAGFTEQGWFDFTFGNYYTLLNCGFRLRPTGGTASGVHPVPLGYGRVYVHLPEGFSYERWMKGLDAGNSFVTTGPLLALSVNDQPLGHTFKHAAGEKVMLRLTGGTVSARPLSTIELISAGEVLRTLKPTNKEREAGGFDNLIDETVELASSTWLALRCYEPQTDGRQRFAHTAPVHVEIAGRPLRPRAEEVQYLVRRVELEIARHAGVLSDAALDEYREALAKYKELAKSAR